MDTLYFLDVLRSEIKRTLGCTDPVTVALGVARAAEALGRVPKRVAVTVSVNIYKNAICVGVPGTGERGLPIAAALGAVIADSRKELALLEGVTPEQLEAARAMVARGAVTVDYLAGTPEVLYLKAQVAAGGDTAHAIISGDYTHIVEVARNGEVLTSTAQVIADADYLTLEGLRLAELFALVETLSASDLAFLTEAAQVNRHAAEAALTDPHLALGRALQAQAADALPAPFAAMHRAQMLVSAASEARMAGSAVPIVAVAGSGNQGINNFLGVLGVAEALSSPPEALARALAISTAVVVLVKGYAARMTAFCGGAIAASCGVAAATVYLLGGDAAAADRAIQTVIGALACIVCDGAKESCAYKMGASVAAAIQFAYLALEGVGVPPTSGLVAASAEATMARLGELNNQGMREMDEYMLNIIRQIQGA